MTHPNEVSKAISVVVNSEKYVIDIQNFSFKTVYS
jgi:hypothetical protein